MECISNFSNTDCQLNSVGLKSRWFNMLKYKMWTDVKFEVGENGIEIVAHRQVLSVTSPVFAAMFYGPLAEKNSPIRIPDVTPEIFNYLLEFIYTDTIPSLKSITIEMLPEIDYVSQKYLLPRLMKTVVRYLYEYLSPKTVVKYYEIVSAIEQKPLIDDCIEIFSKNTREVFETGSILDANLKTLEFIFSLERLEIISEIELLMVAESYAKANGIKYGPYDSYENPQSKGDQPKTLLPLLKQIRFLSMNPRNLATDYELLRKFFSESDILALLLNVIKEEGSAPKPEWLSTNRICRNMAVPFILEVSGEVCVGRVFRVRGVIQKNPVRIDINLMNNNEITMPDCVHPHVKEGCYIILQFSARFQENCVIRNSFISCRNRIGWGFEEKSGGMPFMRDSYECPPFLREPSKEQPFEVAIHVYKDEFRIFANGNFFCSYVHRRPYKEITHFEVKGDVEVNMISLA